MVTLLSMLVDQSGQWIGAQYQVTHLVCVPFRPVFLEVWCSYPDGVQKINHKTIIYLALFCDMYFRLNQEFRSVFGN